MIINHVYLIRENVYIRSLASAADPPRLSCALSLPRSFIIHPPWLSFVARRALSQIQLLQQRLQKKRRVVGSDLPVRSLTS
jgi:hypothetical protein